MGPEFDEAFRTQFEQLLKWRRDVRRFRAAPIPSGLVDDLLRLADLAPSVGNSQPWRIVRVEQAERRAEIRRIFEDENIRAESSYSGEHAEAYAKLKLAGIDVAPVQLAVFCDTAPEQGHGLGRATMPETLCYSVVGMIQTLWLAARLHGVGLGWVSILDPARVHSALDVPEAWKFVAYLCLGYPVESHEDPELERFGWQERTAADGRVLLR